MKNLILCLIAILVGVSTYAQTPRGAYDADKYFRNVAQTENVWDTIPLGWGDYLAKSVEIRVKSGDIFFSFSQGIDNSRDTVAHLDSAGTGTELQYINRIAKYLYVKGSGGSAVIDVYVQYGTGNGIIKSGGAYGAQDVNLYGYAHKDSSNEFEGKVVIDDSLRVELTTVLKDTLVIHDVNGYVKSRSNLTIAIQANGSGDYLSLQNHNSSSGLIIGNANNINGIDISSGNVSVAELRGTRITALVPLQLKSDSDYVDAGLTTTASITGTGQKGVLFIDNPTNGGANGSFILTFTNTIIDPTSSVIITIRNPLDALFTSPPVIYTQSKDSDIVNIIVTSTGEWTEDFIIDYLILP